MKKTVFALLVAVLVFALCACASAPSSYEGEETSYRPAAQMNYIKTALTGKTAKVHTLDPFNGYYILQDVFTFGGRSLTGMTVPVFRTKAMEKGGNFTLSLAKFKISGNEVKLVPGSEVKVKINAKEYGLEADSIICSFIDIDLSKYGIVLAEDETIGFSAPTDSICLFAINATETSLMAEIGRTTPKSFGFLKKGGATYVTETIPVDFRWATSELDAADAAEEAYYADLIAQLRSKWQGKYVSLIGDSISTFGGVTNVSKYNSTMVKNAVYYTESEKMPSYQCTYWGRLANDLGLKLCAMNAWSGSYVYGAKKYNYEDARVIAPAYLYNENGTPNNPSDDIYPDLVLVFMGTNDFNGFGITKCAEVHEIVKEAAGDEARLNSLLDEWFAKVLEKSDGGESLVHDVNYSQFDQAYALMLYRIKKYNPNAQVLAMSLLGNGKVSYNDGKMQWYRETMKTLCDYFGVEFVDWAGNTPIDHDTAKYFYMDVEVNVLHPNAYGHMLMERELLKALAD